MPRLYAIDIRSSTATTEDVVQYDVKRHAHELPVEQRVDGGLQDYNSEGSRCALE